MSKPKTSREVLEWLSENKNVAQEDPTKYEKVKKLYKLKKEQEQQGNTSTPSEGDGLVVGGAKFLGSMGTEMAIGTTGKYGTAALGGTIGSAVPIVGTAIGAGVGYGVGAIGFGITGSIAAQKIENPNADINWGRAIAAGMINLIPGTGVQALKGGAKSLVRASDKAIKYGAIEGGITGAAEAQIESVINKRELAGLGDTLTYAATGVVIGGALGAGVKKLSAGARSRQEAEDAIQEAVVRNDITAKDIAAAAVQNAKDTQVQNRKNMRTLQGANPKKTSSPISSYQNIIRQVEETRVGAASDNAVEQITKSKFDPNNVGWLTKLYNRLPPGKIKEKIAGAVPSIVNRRVAEKALDYQNIIRAGDAQGERVVKAVQRVLANNPSMRPYVDRFFDTGQLDPELEKTGIGNTLLEWKGFVKQQQKILLQQLDNDLIQGMDEKSRMLLAAEIRRSMRDGQYTAREYQLFTDDSFIPNKDKKAAAIAAIKKKLDDGEDLSFGLEIFDVETGDFRYEKTFKTGSVQDNARIDMSGISLRNRQDYVTGKAIVTGAKPKDKGSYATRAEESFAQTNLEKAEEIVENIIKNGARNRKFKAAGAAKQAIDSPIRARGLDPEVDAALMDMMGVIDDPGERARGTVTRLTRLVARHQTDNEISEILLKMGMASKNPDDIPGSVELSGRGGNTGLYVSPEVAIANNQLYASNAVNNHSDMTAAAVTIINDSIGLSKATKVLGNLPSYFVQLYGNAATLIQLGINPIGNPIQFWNGARVAWSDADWFEGSHKLSKKMLAELKDAEIYGIKTGNITASDIRSNIDGATTPVQKALNPVAAVYQVPDTAFRYYAWKVTQSRLKKIYPDLANSNRADDLKRTAAKMVNDVYQQYDKVNPFLRRTTKWGVTPQFATFTMELARNQYNQARQIKDLFSGKYASQLGIDLGPVNKQASYVEGVRRLTGTSLVLGAVPAAMKAAELAEGVTPELKTKLEDSFVEDYAQQSPLMFTYNEEAKTFTYMNSSYLVPQTLMSRAFEAGLNGFSEGDLQEMLFKEFVGEGAFFVTSYIKARENIKEFGKEEKISTDPNNNKRFLEILEWAVEDMFKPGQAREAQKFINGTSPDAIQGVNEVFLRQIGLRRNARDLVGAAQSRARERYADVSANKRQWTQELKYQAPKLALLPDKGESIYKEANRKYRDSFGVIARDYANYVSVLSAEEANEIMKTAGVNSTERAYLQIGKIPNIPRNYVPSTEELISELGIDIYTNTKDNNEKIMATLRAVKDPMLQKKMMNFVKNSRKKQNLNLTQHELTIKGMDALKQIQFLQDVYPGARVFYEELSKKGVLKNDTYRALLQ